MFLKVASVNFSISFWRLVQQSQKNKRFLISKELKQRDFWISKRLVILLVAALKVQFQLLFYLLTLLDQVCIYDFLPGIESSLVKKNYYNTFQKLLRQNCLKWIFFVIKKWKKILNYFFSNKSFIFLNTFCNILFILRIYPRNIFLLLYIETVTSAHR